MQNKPSDKEGMHWKKGGILNGKSMKLIKRRIKIIIDT